jgi:hypothetical protein
LAWAQQVPAKASDISKLKMNRPNGKKHKTWITHWNRSWFN